MHRINEIPTRQNLNGVNDEILQLICHM